MENTSRKIYQNILSSQLVHSFRLPDRGSVLSVCLSAPQIRCSVTKKNVTIRGNVDLNDGPPQATLKISVSVLYRICLYTADHPTLTASFVDCGSHFILQATACVVLQPIACTERRKAAWSVPCLAVLHVLGIWAAGVPSPPRAGLSRVACPVLGVRPEQCCRSAAGGSSDAG
jgi:hypothetical protein